MLVIRASQVHTSAVNACFATFTVEILERASTIYLTVAVVAVSNNAPLTLETPRWSYILQ